MTVNRRQFAKVAGTATLAIAWQQACTEVGETGEVTVETVRTLLDAQGSRGIYESPDELERPAGNPGVFRASDFQGRVYD